MIKLASPAKVNLFLRVLRRRSDGFHELASLFQTIGLCDQLEMSFSDADELCCNVPEVPTNRSNLIWKAADLFRQKTGHAFKLKIVLDKQIPVEAGLGGGSSNAATTLWGLNHLLGNAVSPLQLSQWAAELGSDVPFFLSSGTAYCTGRGEVVRDLPLLQKQKIWIFKPFEGLSTPAVFNQLKVDALPAVDPEACLSAFYSGSPCYFNDLEGPAFALMPALSQLKTELNAMGFEHSFLTGTGTAFVCVGDPAKFLEKIPHKALSTHVAKAFQRATYFINRSPEAWYQNES